MTHWFAPAAVRGDATHAPECGPSGWPMHRASVAAQSGSLRGMRSGMLVASAFGLLFLGLRFYELKGLPFRWTLTRTVR
jgi:heme/copper-type cytochrome/quinol oxidase subunit 3